MTLFSESALRKLDQLALTASQVRSGAIKGERRSHKKGQSVEFADYRNYVRGDDLRRLDWNLYARLEKPFIKLLEDEEDLAVHILLDCSASMDWHADESSPTDSHKFTYARRLAGALAYLALGAGDQLTFATLRDGQAGEQYGPARGRQHTLRLIRWLTTLPANASTDLTSALKHYAMRVSRPGLCIILTDLFSPNGWQDGISALQTRGHECVLLQILAPEELEPTLSGDLRLIDSESGVGQEVSLNDGLLYLYRKRVQQWQLEIAGWCTKRAIHFVPINTATPWDELLLTTLRKRGIVSG
jgi:uncharacterized protein (DUF58 family)